MFLSEWRESALAPCLGWGGGDLMTARVSILLKPRVSLTCFRACFLPGRAKDLSAPRYVGLNRDSEDTMMRTRRNDKKNFDTGFGCSTNILK